LFPLCLSSQNSPRECGFFFISKDHKPMAEEQLSFTALLGHEPITTEEIKKVIMANLEMIGEPARAYAITLAVAVAIGTVAGLSAQQIADDAAMVLTMGTPDGDQKS
jgi:hypothetical protein